MQCHPVVNQHVARAVPAAFVTVLVLCLRAILQHHLISSNS